MAKRGFGSQRNSRQKGINPLVAILGIMLVFSFLFVGVILAFSGRKKQIIKKVIVQKPIIKQETLVKVLVPVRNISAGSRLEPSLFIIKEVKETNLPFGVIKNLSVVNGMYAKGLIIEGNPLISENVTDVKPNSQITAKIPPGYRAVSIRVDDTASVEGWARPGAKVDVQWITSNQGTKVTTVIVENAEVLSSNSNKPVQEGASGKTAIIPTTVTLLVPVKDATNINLASTSGRLNLMLRGDFTGSEVNSADTGVTSTKNLLNTSKKSKNSNLRRSGILKIRKPNGRYEEFTLNSEFDLEPIER